MKEELETYYQDEVNHGRLYPNLDDLVSEGLVEKSALDKRTNLYELTTKGQQTVFNRVEWILSKYATSDSRASDFQIWSARRAVDFPTMGSAIVDWL